MGTVTRTEQLESEARRIVSVLSQDDTIRRIIAFGSLVSGRVGPYSDLDLVVVQDTKLRFWDRLKELRQRIKPSVGVDLLVYTPHEFRELVEDRPFFRDEIASKGWTLYERRDEKVV